jgi:hypothetical protein
MLLQGALMLKHKVKTQHRAKTQRRQEKQNQIFAALSCEKHFQTPSYKGALGFTRVAGNYNEPWVSLRLGVFAR